MNGRDSHIDPTPYNFAMIQAAKDITYMLKTQAGWSMTWEDDLPGGIVVRIYECPRWRPLLQPFRLAYGESPVLLIAGRDWRRRIRVTPTDEALGWLETGIIPCRTMFHAGFDPNGPGH